MSSIPDDRVNRIWENPAAQKILEIDLNNVHLLPLISGGYFTEGMTEEQLKKDITFKLKSFQEQGYILLDGAVVASMLKQKENIPRLWGEITESESCSEMSAVIRFDGSIFRLKEETEEYILTPFMSRGFWGFGFGRRIPPFPTLDDLSRTMINREVTAALML